MVTEKRCPTVLLDDSPASSDAFGSHQRVADAVTEVVQTETGGRSIGLEGGWGSGKSTVVQLVAQKLAKIRSPKFQVATFDMWAHQGDPLRRTFLENLIEQLRKCGWVNDKDWELRQDELARRRRADTTSVVPQLTGAGGGFALTLLVIPLGAALISAALTLWAAEKPPSIWVISSLLGVGAVLGFAPAIYYGIWRWRRGKGEDGLSELPALIMGQASTESQTIVTETPDPTSVEFETIFGDLLSEALKGDRRQLLLVVDNLDRVQPEDALSIWSTLQTFLGHSDYREADWIDRLWILIPYDERAILGLWNGSEKEGGKNTNSRLATSFLDKTFQIRFRVPQLLLSNWRGFLGKALQQALPGHKEDDFHGVYRAFAAKGGLEQSAPTPRDLKILVNQIGAMHRKWRDTYNLADYACYSLLQKDGADVHEKLLADDDLGFLTRIMGANWREVIAALHFGVPVEEANQLLLRGPIEAALSEGDGKALAELASVHPVGFWSVLEQSGPFGVNEWSGLGPSELAICATALAECEVFVNADGMHEAESLKLDIREAVLASNSWEPFNATTARGMIAVAELVGESEDIVPSLLKGATNSRVVNEATPRVWISSAFALLDGLTRLGFEERLGEGIGVSLDAQQWLEVSQEIAKRDPDGQLLQYLELRSASEIDEFLAEIVATRQLDLDSFNAAQTAMGTNSRSSFSETASAAFTDFVSGVYWSGNQHAFLMKILRYSRSLGLVTEDQLAESGSAGHYLNHFYSAYSEGHAEAATEAMYGFLQMVPSGEEPTPVGNSSPGHQSLLELLQNPDTIPGTVDHFAHLTKEDHQLPMLFEMANASRPTAPFFLKVLNNLLIVDKIDVSHELVRANWGVIRRALIQDDSRGFKGFLREFPDLEDLVAGIRASDFDSGESGLYLVLLELDDDQDFVAWIRKGLTGVEKDEWCEEIEEEGYLVDLAIELKNRDAGFSLGVGFSGALTEFAKYIADDEDGATGDKYWHQLVGLLNEDQLEILARRTYTVLSDSNGRASPPFFEIFGAMVGRREILGNENRFIYQVFMPIIDAGNPEGVRWISEIASSDPALLVEHEDEPALAEFTESIRQRISNTQEDDPTYEDFVKIGKALQIEVSPTGTGQEDETDADGVVDAQ